MSKNNNTNEEIDRKGTVTDFDQHSIRNIKRIYYFFIPISTVWYICALIYAGYSMYKKNINGELDLNLLTRYLVAIILVTSVLIFAYYLYFSDKKRLFPK